MLKDQIIKELQYKAIRSSGSGGQHVNKVSSKVELQFCVPSSAGLSDHEKYIILHKLKHKLTKEGKLVMTCQESRSQHRNKEIVIQKFFQVIQHVVIPPKIRKKTKPSKRKQQKRLDQKKQHAQKKENRKKLRF